MKTTIATLVSLLLVPAAFAGPPEADRKAILAMAGEFRVHFQFDETLSLQKGYERKTEPYSEEARELVLTVSDTGDRIFLQHLLIAGDRVIKHWGQIWTWEDTHLCEFQGDRTWTTRELSPEETRGCWTQFVASVDDSPRYEGIGRWVHAGETSEWTSSLTARPLPRREYTKRKDYQVLMAHNRHVITPDGWAHEQSNTKTQIVDGRRIPLAREIGLNTYSRIDGFDFEPAREFWAREEKFWSAVAGAWSDILTSSSEVRVAERLDMDAIRSASAEGDEGGDAAGRRLRIAELLRSSLTIPGAERADR